VIIVGAGPAGATLAYELASKGVRVLLLEKETLPRYKCCAGGLTVRAARLLGVDIHEVAEGVVSGAVITLRGENPYRGHHDQTLMYTVMRDKFDFALVKRAQEAGAVLVQGCKVNGVRFSDRGVEVSTSAGDFRSQFVAGADGVGSVVAKALGLKRNADYAVAMQTEVRVSEEQLSRWKSQIVVDLARIAGGYAWVFPKSDHLSIGLACLGSKPKNLRQCYWNFLHSLDISDYTVAKWCSSRIPLYTGEVVASQGRALLLGDAAGLVDPLTGEGIYNAILSAQLSAPVVEKALFHNEVGLHAYQKAVEEEIMPEMKIAYALSRIVVRFPSIAFKMLGRDERVWRGCCHLLRGEINYMTVKRELGVSGGIYRILSRI